MATTDRAPVQNARYALVEARRLLIDANYLFEEATLELIAGKRVLSSATPELAALETKVADAKADVLAARTAESAALTQLRDALSVWLPDTVEAPEDLERLETSEPIVLFPVRLETRFDKGTSDEDLLKVRVYPDEIFLNMHERALTREERTAAEAYYTELNENTDPDIEKKLWRDIVALFGVERSAYILREMLPVFGELGSSSSYWASSSTCGGTIFGGNGEELHFPETQMRAATWTRPGEGTLPDRWIVATYRGSERKLHYGKRIPEPLALTQDPKLPDADSMTSLIPTTDGDYKIDDNIRWTVDFERAVQVGMGVSIELVDGEEVTGFDRIVVLGVKSSMSALETSRMLEKLFDAQHYTRGMAIVGQGSPTNNTEGRPTAYPPEENAGEKSFVIERRRAPLDRDYAHHCLPKDTDGYALAAALGVPSGVMANIDRAYETETQHAQYMNQALWPGTLGYYMRHLMAPALDTAEIFSKADIEAARSYFNQYVWARGSAPTFRLGATPYGVLPIGSLAHWESRSDLPSSQVEDNLRDPLRSLLSTWTENVAKAPKIREGATNPDADLAKVLSCFPSSQQFRLRPGLGSVAAAYQHWLMGWDFRSVLRSLSRLSRETFGSIGFENWEPEAGFIQWLPFAFVTPTVRVAAELSEEASGGNADIDWIRNASAEELNTKTGAPSENTLLLELLRHSTMAEYSRVAETQSTTIVWKERHFFFSTSTTKTIIPSAYDLDEANALKPLASGHLQALQELSTLPSAELDRLFTETLDIASHRVDAWITALPTRRLKSMRAKQEPIRQATKGDFLGGYGWLENVRPSPGTPYPLPDARPAETQSKNGGFIHAPSMSHAAAAAVLRNGHMSLNNESSQAFAVDLSSKRVRDGREIFEGLRNGQPMGALLGYRLERALHEEHPSVPGLEEVRYNLRFLFPLVANKSGHDGDEAAESIAARNVVDGDLLLRAYKNGDLDFAGNPKLPSPSSPQYPVLVAELAKLELRYDAAADLLTAESAFQLVQGNIDRAYPTMSNLVEGAQPPKAQLPESARGGIGLSHRVALVFPADGLPTLPGTWPAATPRAEGEPVLNAWLGQMIGEPSEVQCEVTYYDDDGVVITSTHDEGGTPVVKDSVIITLFDLALHPLDLFALAEAIAKADQDSVLDRRILDVALNDPERAPDAPPASFKVNYDVEGARRFPEVVEILHTAGVVLGEARPIVPSDLASPVEIEEIAESTPSSGDPGAEEYYNRGSAALAGLDTTRGDLNSASTPEDVRTALKKAADYLPQAAYPRAGVSVAALDEQKQAVLRELDLRRAGAPDRYPDPPPLSSRSTADLLENGKKTLEAVFGTSYVAMPAIEAPVQEEIALSLGARSTLLGGVESNADNYLQQMMRSRPRLGHWRKLNLYARTVGMARPRTEVVQLPHAPGEKWLALSFDGEPPEESRSATLLLSYAPALDPTVSWRGLVIDDWTEIIPKKKEQTGMALHYNSPQSQAPQVVMVATPSSDSAQWQFEELLASIEQAMDLARVRVLGLEDLNLGQMLPGIVLGNSPSIEDSVSTKIGPELLGPDFKDLI